MPRQGRTLAYNFPTCDALVGGLGTEVWRLNLEVGRFMKPFGLEGAPEYDGGEVGGVPGSGATGDAVTGVNVIDINPAHQLLCFGTETRHGRGTVEMWDPRSRSRAGILRLPYAALAQSSMSSATLQHPRLPGVDDDSSSGGVAVTALANRNDGLNLAVGTSTGHVLLYDLRANKPYTTKDQGYGLPVKKVEWVESSPATSSDADREGGWVASADEKVVKIWGKDTVRPFFLAFFELSVVPRARADPRPRLVARRAPTSSPSTRRCRSTTCTSTRARASSSSPTRRRP